MASTPTSDRSVQDIGIIHGPVLCFGGAYSNVQALQAMLALARDELQIPTWRMIHTGDVVAYCAQPLQTVELLRASGAYCLMGNCEESVGLGRLDCGCGFPEDSKCNAYSANWYAHVMRELDGHTHLCEWMGSLPRRIEFTLGGRRFAVVHGSPRNISEFLWSSTPDSVLEECLKSLPNTIDGVVSGHSGIPFMRVIPASGRSRLWLNAGVVGMPANDGTSRGWFAVVTPVAGGRVEVSIKALHYEAKVSADAIYAEERLVRGYADSLLSGVWPSHDVLPVEEQMATGVPLSEQKLLWPTDEVDASLGGEAGRKRAIDSKARSAEVAICGTVAATALTALILSFMVWRTKRMPSATV